MSDIMRFCPVHFSMLGLVMATNIFQMYVFWELVGVSTFADRLLL